ncbi:hypothetical protein AG1IA_07043 [Rhizoctonia solani AG-1 IA]|uniref:Uncharacterized protein n=1 Tax=Thanatephorus cucumeris (strain AG1-IA) TaxID=983506 RepID=L8WLV0_THACA|nr:hypothetical protein AG1IA_07043 [Rhizoctonia solani AG-1 IA]
MYLPSIFIIRNFLGSFTFYNPILFKLLKNHFVHLLSPLYILRLKTLIDEYSKSIVIHVDRINRRLDDP